MKIAIAKPMDMKITSSMTAGPLVVTVVALTAVPPGARVSPVLTG